MSLLVDRLLLFFKARFNSAEFFSAVSLVCTGHVFQSGEVCGQSPVRFRLCDYVFLLGSVRAFF